MSTVVATFSLEAPVLWYLRMTMRRWQRGSLSSWKTLCGPRPLPNRAADLGIDLTFVTTLTHTQQYAAGGVDLIWWTDHADAYFGRVADFRISPTTPSQVLPNTWLVGMWGPNAFGKAFLGGVTPPMLDSATGQVRVILPGGDSTTAETVEFSLGVIFNDRIRGAGLTMLSRPLIVDAKFTMPGARLHTDSVFPYVTVLVP